MLARFYVLKNDRFRFHTNNIITQIIIWTIQATIVEIYFHDDTSSSDVVGTPHQPEWIYKLRGFSQNGISQMALSFHVQSVIIGLVAQVRQRIEFGLSADKQEGKRYGT
jgi:hypothetical protein